MKKLKKVALALVAGLLVFGLAACGDKNEGNNNNSDSKKEVTYYWDLKDGWQVTLPLTWENNYLAEKIESEEGNFTTIYYAPKGDKTNYALFSIGVMPQENWEQYAEDALPGIYLEERDGYIYYSVFPEKEETNAKLYKQMLEEAHNTSFQTIKKTENLPQDPNAPITSPDDDNNNANQ